MLRWAGIVALFVLIFPAIYAIWDAAYFVVAAFVPHHASQGAIWTQEGRTFVARGMVALFVWPLALWLVWRRWRPASDTAPDGLTPGHTKAFKRLLTWFLLLLGLLIPMVALQVASNFD